MLSSKLGRDRYEGTYADDVCPLTDCLSVVQRWIRSRPAEIEHWKKNLSEAQSKRSWDSHFVGFCHKVLGMIMLEEFRPEAHVFNVSEYNYSVPSDPTGWWAVMCDIHG